MGKEVCAITVDEVPANERLRQLAQDELPADADRGLFVSTLLHGVRRYTRSAGVPSDNEVHEQIEALERAASWEQYEKVADLLESSLPAARAARDCLKERLTTPASRGATFPDAATLRDSAVQKKACELVRQLCTLGGESQEGRRRSTGKRSRNTWRTLLYGPTPTPHPPKRDAEFELVSSVLDAYHRATGKPPAWTAHHDFPGPIARIAKEVLTLVGATDANAVSLMRELHKRRHTMGWKRSAYQELYERCASRID